MSAKKAALLVSLPVNQPAPASPVVIAGMQALQNGQASEHQQREVFNWLLHEAAGISQPSFRPGDPCATAFMDGRRFVGIQMMILLKQKASDNG